MECCVMKGSMRLLILMMVSFVLCFQPLTLSSSNRQISEFEGFCYKDTIVTSPLYFSRTMVLDPDEIIDQNQTNTGGLGVRLANESMYYSQRIQPSIDILTNLSLLVRPHGSFSDDAVFTISFRKHLHVDLKTYTVDPNALSTNMSWIECDFGIIPLDVNESYYIVCHLKGASNDRFVEWFYDVDNPYKRGRPYYSESGSEWKEFDINNADIDFCFQIKGYRNNPPHQPMKPEGPTEGQYDKDHAYKTITTDDEADEIYYQWDWGDGQKSDWLGPYGSGVTCSAVHSWHLQGSYLIKVKSRDTWGFESDWSEELTIRMKKNRIFSLFDILFEYYQ
jgi:hypothetical protein